MLLDHMPLNPMPLDPMPHTLTQVIGTRVHRRSAPAIAAVALMAVALTACGDGDAPKPARLIDPPQETVSRTGDVSVRAHVLQTSRLSEAMARQYGLHRDDGTVMLLVGVRRGPEGAETALPAAIAAAATDLQGRRRPIELRELRTGDLLDYVGTVEIAPPETLRFELKIEREGGASSTMQFSRDFLAD